MFCVLRTTAFKVIFFWIVDLSWLTCDFVFSDAQRSCGWPSLQHTSRYSLCDTSHTTQLVFNACFYPYNISAPDRTEHTTIISARESSLLRLFLTTVHLSSLSSRCQRQLNFWWRTQCDLQWARNKWVNLVSSLKYDSACLSEIKVWINFCLLCSYRSWRRD